MPDDKPGDNFTDFLNKLATKREVSALFKQLIKATQAIKAELAQKQDGNTSKLSQKVDDAIASLEAAEERFAKLTEDTKAVSASEVRTLTRLLQQEITRVEDLIPDVTDLAPLEQKIAQAVADLEAKIPKLPEELTPAATRDKLEALEGDERLDKAAIKGLDNLEKDIQEAKSIRISPGRALLQLYVDGSKKGAVQYLNLIPGSGISLTYNNAHGRNDITISATGSGSFSVLDATGDVDDSNTSFTFASEPVVVVINGASYRHGAGVTIAGTSVTTDNPVGTGGSIYGIG